MAASTPAPWIRSDMHRRQISSLLRAAARQLRQFILPLLAAANLLLAAPSTSVQAITINISPRSLRASSPPVSLPDALFLCRPLSASIPSSSFPPLQPSFSTFPVFSCRQSSSTTDSFVSDRLTYFSSPRCFHTAAPALSSPLLLFRHIVWGTGALPLRNKAGGALAPVLQHSQRSSATAGATARVTAATVRHHPSFSRLDLSWLQVPSGRRPPCVANNSKRCEWHGILTLRCCSPSARLTRTEVTATEAVVFPPPPAVAAVEHVYNLVFLPLRWRRQAKATLLTPAHVRERRQRANQAYQSRQALKLSAWRRKRYKPDTITAPVACTGGAASREQQKCTQKQQQRTHVNVQQALAKAQPQKERNRRSDLQHPEQQQQHLRRAEHQRQVHVHHSELLREDDGVRYSAYKDVEIKKHHNQKHQVELQPYMEQQEELQDFVVALQDNYWTSDMVLAAGAPNAPQSSAAIAGSTATMRDSAIADTTALREDSAAIGSTVTTRDSAVAESVAPIGNSAVASTKSIGDSTTVDSVATVRESAIEGSTAGSTATVKDPSVAAPQGGGCTLAAAGRHTATAAGAESTAVLATLPESLTANKAAAASLAETGSVTLSQEAAAGQQVIEKPTKAAFIATEREDGNTHLLGVAIGDGKDFKQHVMRENQLRTNSAVPSTSDEKALATEAATVDGHSPSHGTAGAGGAEEVKATGSSKWRQQGNERVVDLPADVLPNISWKDIRQRVEGPPRPPLVSSEYYQLDAEPPPGPFEHLINLDPAASLLLQLPCERSGLQEQRTSSSANRNSFILPPQEQQDQQQELQRQEQQKQQLQQQAQQKQSEQSKQQQQSQEIKQEQQSNPRTRQGLFQIETQQQKQQQEPPSFMRGDVEEAEGGAWVSGKWISDAEVERAREEGEARMQPFIAEIREAVEQVEKEDEARAAMEGPPLPLTEAEIDGMVEEEQLKKELRLRGYRTGGSIDVLRTRLKQAARADPRVYEEASTTTEGSVEALEESVISDAQKAWNTYQEATEEISQPISNPSDPAQVIRRWIARTELFKAADDPVGYFSLDMQDKSLSTSPDDVAGIDKRMHGTVMTDDEINEEEDRSTVAQEHLHDSLGESIPKIFGTHEEEIPVEQAPTPQTEWDDMNVDDRKRAFFAGNPNSIVKETVKGLAEEFGVPPDFIGDFLCRHGAEPPIPVDVPLCELVDTANLWNLTEYLQLQDAARIQDMYPSETIEQIANDFNCTVKQVLQACLALSIKLPFLEKSRLNSECYNALTVRLAKQRGTFSSKLSHGRNY